MVLLQRHTASRLGEYQLSLNSNYREEGKEVEIKVTGLDSMLVAGAP